MTLRNVLALYFEIQNETRKSVNYHKTQNPGFKNLISKLEQLCKEIREVHIFVTGKEPDNCELNREQWVRVFDSVMLNREYDYLSMFKGGKLTNNVHLYSFWPTHQSVILQQIFIEWNELVPSREAVELLWLLVQSVYQQSRMFAKEHLPDDTTFPSLETISRQSKEST